jgi:hypothetical protein
VSDPQPPSISVEERKALVACGLCRVELDALRALAVAAHHVLRLPELHPAERQEACALLHRLQNDVLARPGTRALGWPRE